MHDDKHANHDAIWLRRAARLALRGHGGAEPNPLVGCVIVADSQTLVGWGYHRTFGGPHAEVEALHRAGNKSRGAIVYVTLEPCTHTGKTGPCADALIKAGVKRVVIGRRDTTAEARGGAVQLQNAGIEITWHDTIFDVRRVSDPFFHRIETNLPWVITKWAQTLDGRIATSTGDSKWISCERSRRMVHRERGRVDVLLTGVGTVLRDDPLLTARHGQLRRIARRVILDPHLLTPIDSQIVQTARDMPVTFFCTQDTYSSRPKSLAAFKQSGAEVIALPGTDGIPIRLVLEQLVEKYNAATVLVEAGAGVLSRLFNEKLVNEAWVFIAPRLLGDTQSMPVLQGRSIATIAEGIRLQLLDDRRRNDDIVLRYSVAEGAKAPQ